MKSQSQKIEREQIISAQNERLEAVGSDIQEFDAAFLSLYEISRAMLVDLPAAGEEDDKVLRGMELLGAALLSLE